MEHGAFEPPLSDEQLKELGRLVVNCGFAEFLLNFHVGKLFNLEGSARISLVAPLTTRRKIEILEAKLADIPKPETRALVDEACKMVSPTIRARNYMLHGIWGFESGKPDAKPIVISPREYSGHRKAGEIAGHADSLAVASRKLAEALMIDEGTKPPAKPERLVIQLS